ncbi:MAG TPA: hypothetical protein VHT91_47540 [Kofleriaceae bacterium]|jgi:hypothetical protein|nr:hypothetical protein [Kofleriaceae bacterium]
MFREDYILRMVQQLAAAIARIAGLNQREEHDQALAEADRAWDELLGDTPADLAASVDSRTLAGMLRQPARIRLASQILGEQARALAGQRDATGAARRARRALELLLEARAAEAAAPDPPARGQRGTPDDAADAAAIHALLQRVPADALAPRYRALLTGIA